MYVFEKPFLFFIMAYMAAYREAGVSYARYLSILNRAVTNCLKEPLASKAKEQVTYYDYADMTWPEGGGKPIGKLTAKFTDTYAHP